MKITEIARTKINDRLILLAILTLLIFKVDSLIGDSEVKDTKRIINELRSTFPNDNLSWVIFKNMFRVEANKQENDNQEAVGFLFSEDESKQGKPKTDQSNEKPHHSKDYIKLKPDLNSISEILAEKVDFDMSTIKEMVESLEDDSLHFIHHVHPEQSKLNQNMSSLDEIKQNSFDKIIKYMKNEINRIDKLRRKDKNKEKVQSMIKEFLVNLKRIELNQTNPDDKEEDKQENNSNIYVQDHEDCQNVDNRIECINDSLKIMHDYIIDDCDCSSIKEIILIFRLIPLNDKVWLISSENVQRV